TALSRADRSVENAAVKRIAAASLTGRSELGDQVIGAFLVGDGSGDRVAVSVARRRGRADVGASTGLLHQARKRGSDTLVLRIVSQVLELVRIGLGVEKHRATFTAVELGVAPGFGPHGHGGEIASVLAPGAIGGSVPRGRGISQQRSQTYPFQS